jgi:hypothetical protein
VTAFAGVELALVDWLTVDLPGNRVCTELPDDLADAAPVIQVVRIGGPHDDNDPNLQIPTVSVDCFSATRGGATDLANAVDTSLRKRLPGATIHGARFGLVRTLTGPSWRPWEDAALRRFGSTYQLWVRASTAAAGPRF